MPAAARVSDLHTCPKTPAGPILQGASTVLICGMPAARISDMVTCTEPEFIVTGEKTVLIEGKPAARMGDMTEKACPSAGSGVITTGCPTVLIGSTYQETVLKVAAENGAPFCEPVDAGQCGEEQSKKSFFEKFRDELLNYMQELHHEMGETIKTIQDYYAKVTVLFNKLSQVDWQGSFDTKGLEGDWHALYMAWFFETSPSNLGVWGMKDGSPLVTITSKGYINDLKSKPHYKNTLDKFKKEHPNLSRIKVGDSTNNLFQFTGEGSAIGEYNALEWFLGSYNTKMTVTQVDQIKKRVMVEIVVENKSHWESGTRVPAIGRNAGLPPYLIGDSKREAFGPGGDFWQKFIWNDSIQY